MKRALALLALALFTPTLLMAGTIGFDERFALAEDRAAVLKELIPGTPDYYYYHCLHYQHTGQTAELDTMLKAWTKRHSQTARVHEILDRQALLTYDKDHKKALERIRYRLGLNFNHQRRELDHKPDFPTSLDQVSISWEALRKRELSRNANTLDGFEDTALDILVKETLSPERRRHLLRRLMRPDHPDMARLVVDDLNFKHSGGFGSHKIHNQLLLTQLDACLELKPDLLKTRNFINTYLLKLRPHEDVDWTRDPTVRRAYYERLWTFVQRLPPSENSLKAHALFHILADDRAKGVYDRDRFMAYLRLPRNVGYINRTYAARQENRHVRANLSANYKAFTMLVTVKTDEPLVRDYLAHFLVEAEDTKAFQDLIDSNYLKRLFAETKVLNGVGDMERWYSLLSPSEYKAIKDRVDIDFLPTNREIVADDDKVSLKVAVKNVDKLIVKTYVINTMNFYRENMAEVTTAIDLDGLVANHEETINYGQIPQRRHTETFDLPHITRPGVYVVELIGNGKSSRAVIRKGRLTFAERTGAAGHVFTVYNAGNERLMKTSLWMDGHAYEAEDNGEIAVPFSTKPGEQKIILTHGTFSELHRFGHEQERYELNAGFYTDREALLDRQTATLVIRPQLLLNGRAVDVALLEEVVLHMTSVDNEGISSTRTVKDLTLHDDRETTYEFRVPANLASLSFLLQGKVKNLSEAREDELTATSRMEVNAIDKTEHTEDMHLRHAGGAYVIEILGKTGEARQARPLHLDIKHHDIKPTVTRTLMTSPEGRIDLGALEDIDWVRARFDNGFTRTWSMTRDSHSQGGAIHSRAAEGIAVPFMEATPEALSDIVSLLETRGGVFVRDVSDRVALQDGFLRITDLDPGDYSLFHRRHGNARMIRVTAGARDGRVAISRDRQLELGTTRPLQIVAVTPDAKKGTARIQLAHAGADTRVHVTATHYVAQDYVFNQIGFPLVPGPEWARTGRPLSQYMSGRKIGDEYRYILERRYAERFPGNMLRRPSLLLNPWSLRKTDTGHQDAKEGESLRDIHGSRSASARGRAAQRHGGGGRAGGGAASPNLDYLANPALVMSNLRPDKDGVVTIDLEQASPRQQIHIVALNGESGVYREVTLPADWQPTRDLRLARILDPAKHFTEQKLVSVAEAGKPFTLENIRSSQMEAYDSLTKVYGLFDTLNPNATLKEFGFVLSWPELDAAKKRELYSKYACHELSFFIHEKDPDFFKTIVQPYLLHKKDKTFMDHWLLGDDLAAYLKPWAHGRMNIVERALLGRVIAAERAAAARHVKDRYDLVPPDIETFNHLFKTALRGSAMAMQGGAFSVGGGAGSAEADAMFDGVVIAAAFENASLTSAPAPAAAPRRARGKQQTMSGRVVRADGRVAGSAKDLASQSAPLEELETELGLGRKKRDAVRRSSVRQLYRKLDKTEEWVENNYYHQPIEAQLAKLVPVCGFWMDYAAHEGQTLFLSTHVAEAASNFTEMMFALAVLDLPFTSGKHESTVDGVAATVVPENAVIVFHKEVNESRKVPARLPLLVSQNFFARDDRYSHKDNERLDKFVTDEFLYHRVYGCQVVLTNPTSTRRKVDVLMQIPKGAMPVLNGFFTRSRHAQIEPYATQKLEYYFYFPLPGRYPHFPSHVAQDGQLVAFTDPFVFNVVSKLSNIDKASWDYISQYGSEKDVRRYLQDNNVDRLNLDLIAFRMRNRAFFDEVIALLAARHVYNHTLWSYSIHHDAVAPAREFLQYSRFAGMVGMCIDSPLLTLDPVARHTYQHKEYWPLVNARTYQLGAERKILNDQFFAQYMRLMQTLRYRPALTDADEAAVAYTMFLQDRVAEGLVFFDRIDPHRIPSRMPYDYMKAYAAFYRADAGLALKIAARYKDHPVPRWQQRFAQIIAQAEEIRGGKAAVIDEDDRAQRQTRLADTAPSFDFKVENRQIVLNHRNIETCEINFYLMDIELLFSKEPFVEEVSGQFSVIKPNRTQILTLARDGKTVTLDLPKDFRDSNVMVEIVANGIRRMQAYYPHSLDLQIAENYGHVRVTHAKSGDPLPKVYVKVYARMKGGEVKFYKDGYTDLRGRFDYTSLNTNELDHVERFALLIMSDTHGAVVREAAPPKR